MLSSWYRGDRFVGYSGEHMEVKMMKTCGIQDVVMCEDIMLKIFDHQEHLL